MKIVGCDLHARQQSIAMLDTETGEFTEKIIRHEGNTDYKRRYRQQHPDYVRRNAAFVRKWRQARRSAPVSPTSPLRASPDQPDMHWDADFSSLLLRHRL
jgi:hypothetical protein